MKNRAVLLLLGLIISNLLTCGQISKDTLQKPSVYPRFNDFFSAEESWQIHKEAYRKQLEAQGLSATEISRKMDEYETQKDELIEKLIQQRKEAEKQRQLAEIQREEAARQRKEAEAQRVRAEEIRQQAAVQREKAEEQRKDAEQQRQQIRAEAENQRKKAEEMRQEAEIQREKAAEQRKEAEAQRKIAEEWRNSIHKLMGESITLSERDTDSKVVKIKITENKPLFFNINGEIHSGSVLIEIFNPNGKKEGELSLEHFRESSPRAETITSGNTSGSLNKTINSPETGEWTVKITHEKADGIISVSAAQYIKPTADE